MNPTINMWSNRLKRIVSAWNDPTNERVRSSSPLIKSKFAWWCLFASEITSYLAKPVTQDVYDLALEQHPSCKRFNDYRIFRTSRNEVFTNRDIHTSISECKESQRINSMLEKQRKITNSQKYIK